ncbi:hypothetical protein NIES25_33830 [Nostoc linckia NIES-25]|nr:hypothetical protein NIES25_33830 [Nostoc linckia NIES-25]
MHQPRLPIQVTLVITKKFNTKLMSSTPLTLNLVEGSVSFSFSPQAARELKAAIDRLMESLKAAAAKPTPGGTKATPQPPLEYRYTGEVFLEVFCNPNIWPTPFAAKVLLTVRTINIRITTEAELTRIIDDINQYLDQVG